VSDFDPRDGEHITDLVLDEWLTGELSPEAHARADAHFAGCERCRDKRAAYQAEHAAFLAQAPVLKRPVAALPKAPKPWSKLMMAGAGVLAAAAAALLMLPAAPGIEPPGTRRKGGPSASFFIKHGERVTRGVSGATVQPGDALRFTYTSDAPVHLALLGLDARSASVYFPSGARAVRMAAGRDVALEFSVVLDDQLGEEHIHALFCSEPVELDPLRAQLQSTRALNLPASCTAQRIVLHKALPR
jgi:anti-sigma factor RsiW